MVIDELGRRFSSLRVSLTAACNYACTYCVPDGKKLQAQNQELSETEMVDAVALLVDGAGIEKLRITGGEPLISPKFDGFTLGVSKLDIEDVSITTNGQFLLQKLPVIQRAEIRRLNVSLDTLDADKFGSIARSGDLETVLAGIEAALDAGMKIKINTVPIQSGNQDQIIPLLDFCLDRNIELRFIELMNMGHLKRNKLYEQEFIGMDTLLNTIGEKYVIEKTHAPMDSTAVRFSIPNRGSFGVIANETEPFCRTCSRLRLSSNGRLYGCLSNSKNYSMRDLLAMPRHVALNEMQEVLRMAMSDKQRLAFTGETTVMKFIGG